MTVTIRIGDCRELLKSMPDESVHCVVTSPPYWGLRDYGVAGQIGLEADYLAYVEEIAGVFREVRRVLRADGVCWLNLGDAYATGAGAVGQHPGGGEQGKRWLSVPGGRGHRGRHLARQAGKQAPRITAMGPTQPNRMPQTGLKPKDLVGMPWRVAFALQADGWWLRQDIIWHKPNPMPESVTDRCTKSHEYIFHLAKSERYYFDAEAIAEASLDATIARSRRGRSDDHKWADGGPGNQTIAKTSPSPGRSGNKQRKAPSARGVPVAASGRTAGAVAGSVPWEGYTRNKRSVWTVTTQPFSEAHFATFPPDLIEPCILAGCPRGGVVLDPFGGAGTTGLVADRLGRDAILIELNPEYAAMAERRLRKDGGMFARVSAA